VRCKAITKLLVFSARPFLGSVTADMGGGGYSCLDFLLRLWAGDENYKRT